MPWKKQRGMPQIKRITHEIDAEGKVLGRLATKIAMILMGKHRPDYVPHIDSGDIVKVKNVDKIALTGKKWDQKEHIRTSNRPGGLKRTPVSRVREEKPDRVLRHAVKYMLPKNRTQSARLKRLVIV